jgi:hypothetical protein
VDGRPHRRPERRLEGPRTVVEGGKGTLPKVVRFQLRPDPLAR